MDKQKEIKIIIEKLRIEMNEMIGKKDDLLSEELINASKKLDDALNEYHQITSQNQSP